ncbi:MAG: 50S ribosomal protein L11 methyltransferase [Verrucomicrobia subdivision 3 bacterium]|nr:50S ribosomal protein L11 methyltransferase [Limisphaerales bacterium]
MKTAFRQVALATTPEAEAAVGEMMHAVFGFAPSVFTHPEMRVPVVSVYLDEKKSITAVQRQTIAEGMARIEECGLATGDWKLEVKPLRREDWVDSWKRHFQPIRIGEKLLVRPSWRKDKAVKGQAVVVLDPGLSFGTGQHATTKYCLRQLVAQRRSGAQSLLDVGTGSGILAIAGVKLGYRPVRAIDFDSEAVRVARANAKRNRVTRHLEPKVGDVTKLSSRARVKYDVVCANLYYDLLAANAPRLIARVKPDGVLVLAGVLETQFAEVQAAVEGQGMVLKKTTRQGEWRSGVFVHAA